MTSLFSIRKIKSMTMLEVLVSITILAICVTSFLPMFTSSRKTFLMEERYLQAVFLAQEIMEKICYKNELYPELPVSSYFYDDQLPDFRCYVTKEEIIHGLFRINLTVSFSFSGEHHIELSSVISELPASGKAGK